MIRGQCTLKLSPHENSVNVSTAINNPHKYGFLSIAPWHRGLSPLADKLPLANSQTQVCIHASWHVAHTKTCWTGDRRGPISVVATFGGPDYLRAAQKPIQILKGGHLQRTFSVTVVVTHRAKRSLLTCTMFTGSENQSCVKPVYIQRKKKKKVIFYAGSVARHKKKSHFGLYTNCDNWHLHAWMDIWPRKKHIDTPTPKHKQCASSSPLCSGFFLFPNPL